MFSFGRRKKAVEVYPYLRRLCDLTAPNLSVAEEERVENRYNRTIPTLLCPWRDEKPVLEEASVVLTRDLSDRGLGLIVQAPVVTGRVVVAFWLSREEMQEPLFFLGNVEHATPLGGGAWLAGVKLAEYANQEYREQLHKLSPLAVQLLPPAPVMA